MKTAIEIFVIEKVKQKRIDAGFSQVELAEHLGLSSGFIGKIESFKFNTKYNLNHIAALSKIFNCSPKDFFPDIIE